MEGYYICLISVTKIQNDFGFIDEEIFFHKNVCVKGNFPQKGERVLVEATYNANMTTKWNATRVQILPSGGGAGSGVTNRTSNIPSLLGSNAGKGYNAVPPPDRESRFDDIRSRDPRKRELSPVRRSLERSRDRDTRRDTISQESDRKRRREDREKDRDRRHSPDRRDRRPVLPERRRKPAARYMVSIPKISLAMAMADVLELKRRYTNLYVPSDFFNTQIRWIDAFPPNAPYSIQKPCAFHVMSKDVESPFENDALLDPPDADYLFSAKVSVEKC
jgi:S1-like/BURAN domain